MNRLARETSPYLLQHAANPVDWYPWGDEAFERARREDKPIFLSIGYSTCHWCHVMARESFEDPEVARLLNDAFVPVKVDREERPDIDHVYISVCQVMTGSAGWPLTIIMTPEGRPFFAGTYIPKESRPGGTGLVELIPRVKGLWASRRAKALGVANEVAAVLARTNAEPASSDARDARADFESILDAGYAGLAEAFDPEHGGFGGAPKFPSPHNLLFLLRYWKRTSRAEALVMVERTLEAMRAGGIFDHLGLGFHRYSTDREWRMPHFEKMLYDQAMLAMAYTEAAQATGKPEYAKTVREILAYVLRDLASPDGAFYSAEDADSEGGEGKFYVWRAEEIRQALGEADAALFARAYNVEEDGNGPGRGGGQGAGLPSGANVLYLSPGGGAHGRKEHGDSNLAALRQKIYAWRARRERPRRDEKILTDWNGLMIAALAKAGRALDEPLYSEAARRAADFVLSRLRDDDGRLLHVWNAGEARLAGNLDDHAFLAWGLIEVYQAIFEPRYLKAALDVSNMMIAHFGDRAAAGYYFTADDGESLFVRQKQVYDGAIPSGNSVALSDLLRLGRLTGEQGLEHEAARMAAWLGWRAGRAPLAHVHSLAGLDFAIGPSQEVVIAGAAGGDDTRAMLQALASRFLPRAVVILVPTDRSDPEIKRLAPFVERYGSLEGRAAAYVCHDFTCALPTTDPRRMLDELQDMP